MKNSACVCVIFSNCFRHPNRRRKTSTIFSVLTFLKCSSFHLCLLNIQLQMMQQFEFISSYRLFQKMNSEHLKSNHLIVFTKRKYISPFFVRLKKFVTLQIQLEKKTYKVMMYKYISIRYNNRYSVIVFFFQISLFV